VDGLILCPLHLAAGMKMKRLAEVARAEVFFTAHLYFACKSNPEGFANLLRRELALDQDVEIKDLGFEVCLFRDLSKAGLIPRLSESRKSFEKQTFDNVYILSDDSIVLVEAKAHGKFDLKQLDKLGRASKILSNDLKAFSRVYLVGIHSSLYSPKTSTMEPFDARLTWSKLSVVFPGYADIFNRAEEIYNDRKGRS
jgi:hypothetical protein